MLLPDKTSDKWCHSTLVELVMIACYYSQMLLSIQKVGKWCHSTLVELDMVPHY